MNASDPTPSRPGHLLPNLLQFARLLRALGVEVTPAQVHTLLEALAILGIRQRVQVRDAARTVLISRREHLELFARAFDLFWSADAFRAGRPVDLGRMLRRASRREEKLQAASADAEARDDAPRLDEPLVELRQTYSARELLRRKDFAELSADELAEVRRLMQEQILELRPRRTRRLVAARSGHRLDVRRTMRRALRHGEFLELAWRRRREKPRPLVVLCDISGSMEAYSRLFLQFIYSLRRAAERLEAFVFSTRLTRITRQLEHRDVDEALRRAAASVPDWGGGTRIGEALLRFNHDWARRVLGQGAVVLVISDGWDRGEPQDLERQIERLSKSCDRLIWLNPLLGSPGYEPLTRGIRIVLRHADDFLPVHNLESLEQLRRHLARLGRMKA